MYDDRNYIINYTIQVERRIVHKLHKVRRYCSGCYDNNSKLHGRKIAKNLTKKVVTFCNMCKFKPYFCLECFNKFHWNDYIYFLTLIGPQGPTPAKRKVHCQSPGTGAALNVLINIFNSYIFNSFLKHGLFLYNFPYAFFSNSKRNSFYTISYYAEHIYRLKRKLDVKCYSYRIL